MRLSISAAVRAAGAAALVYVALSAAGCAKAPRIGKGSLHIVLTAEGTCNSCGQATGYPLTYRVLQVKDASALTGTTLTQVWDKEEKICDALVASGYLTNVHIAVANAGARRTQIADRLRKATRASHANWEFYVRSNAVVVLTCRPQDVPVCTRALESNWP